MKNLKDRLRSLNAGEVQSVDGMSVIPLIDEDNREYDEISPLEEVDFDGTSSYGTMHYRNNSDDGVGVIPTNQTIISKEMAQDHSMGSSGLVEAGSRVQFENACCIQSSQGGRLTGNKDNHMFGVLPVSLRGILDQYKRNREGYSRLWNSIGNWNKDVVRNPRQALDVFYDEFEDELDNFLAEFEIVKNQIGALVFFGGDLVGVEIAPHKEYWNRVWNWLVRGCYGSEFLRQNKMGSITSRVSLPDLDSCDTIEEIEATIESYLTHTRNYFLQSVNPQLEGRNTNYQSVKDINLDFAEVSLNSDNNFIGDIVTNKDDDVVYTSLVRK